MTQTGTPEESFLGYELRAALDGPRVEQYSIDLKYNTDSSWVSNFGVGVDLFKLVQQAEYYDPAVDEFEEFYNFHAALGMRTTISSNWDLIANLRPLVSSTLLSSLSTDDIFLRADLGFQTKWEKDNNDFILHLGASYGTQFGAPGVYPKFSFTHHPTAQFSYSLGFPSTKANYLINMRSELSFETKYGGFYVNSFTAQMSGDQKSNLEYRSVDLSLIYTLKTSTWNSNFKLGYAYADRLQIQPDQGVLTYDYTPGSTIVLGLNIDFNLNNVIKSKTYENQ